jgi:hypothetical protein
MFLKKIFCNFTKLGHFELKSKRFLTEIIKQEDLKPATNPHSASNIFANSLSRDFKLTQNDLAENQRVGADIFLTPEIKETFVKTGIRFDEINNQLNQNNLITDEGWRMKFLKNNLFLQEYDTILREFFQATAQMNMNGLKLNLENRLMDYFLHHISPVKRDGYQIDIENLKIKQNYKLLRLEIYKNLSLNRYENRPFKNYTFSQSRLNPLGSHCILTETGVDKSYFTNNQPYILATTMIVETPMSLAIFNQNRSRKLFGGNDGRNNVYVVRFESQLNFSDFLWILPTQNKPSRLRSTRITDFNNVLRGNPYFTEKWDLIDGNQRFNYMSRDESADKRVINFIEYANKNRRNLSY